MSTTNVRNLVAGAILETETGKFHNSNGRDYRVILLCPFTMQDKMYYCRPEWYHNGRYALLQDNRNKEYVVANLLGETSWASGTYYDEEYGADALQDYLNRCKEYGMSGV